MADTRRSPWRVYPGDANSPTPLKEGWVFIDSISWSEYTDPAHICRLIDHKGDEVFQHRGSSDFSPVIHSFGRFFSVKDLQVDQIDSGLLLIYIR